MSTDPGIILSGQPGFDVSKYLQVAQQAQQLKQNQVQLQKQNALSGLLSNPQSYGPDGSLSPDAQRNVNALNPEFGLKYRQQQIDTMVDQAKLKASGDDAQMRKLELSGSIADASEKARKDTLAAGGSAQASLEAATKVRNKMFDESGGIFSNDESQKAKAATYDPVMAASFSRLKPGEIQDERLAQQIAAQTQKEADIDRRQTDVEKQNATRDAIMMRALTDKEKGGGTKKAPAGFEWDPQKPDELRPIAGGPKDPNSKPWSGREKVYAERIMGSAREGAADLANVVELPIGAGTSWLGKPHEGTSAVATTWSGLKNSVTPQEAQDYQVMVSGIQRNLSAIESMGLAPSGSLTNQMEAVVVKPGDSQLTKLRRLAQTRQIIERGLDTPLSDPAIPDVMKDAMRETISSVQKAVPFTQHDLTDLERRAESNPKVTLQDVMKEKGLSKDDKDDSKTTKSPPLTNAQGWKLHKDAKGNMAYVGPNNEIAPVQ